MHILNEVGVDTPRTPPDMLFCARYVKQTVSSAEFVQQNPTCRCQIR